LPETFVQYRSHLKGLSRSLRQEVTDVERLLWSRVRRKQLAGYQFYRQKPIGPYIVDFYCSRKQLVIELDGGQHYSEEGEADDRERDAYLRAHGFRVLRFSNREVLDELDRVIEVIYRFLATENPPLPSFAKGGSDEQSPLSFRQLAERGEGRFFG